MDAKKAVMGGNAKRFFRLQRTPRQKYLKFSTQSTKQNQLAVSSKQLNAERKTSKAINRRFTQMDTERNPFKNITAEAKSLSAWRKAHSALRTEFRVLSTE